ncbi:transmembrane protein 276-like [Erpetoichthys calabaricus]|uniref:transmembrane protein 276-like n=1 Tax=Erpetoichthys calabaricus TaxID=27687 RepID=UPI0022347FAA|nr:transmembrane protein 276-like [Erpetoichthys calabaricus]
MADNLMKWIAALLNVLWCLITLDLASRAAKLHRAPAIGILLTAFSSVFRSVTSLVPLPGSSQLQDLQDDLFWTSCLFAPALVSFGFLWLSEDRTTGNTLLCGSLLAASLSDWFSEYSRVLIGRFMVISSLSCSLTVCAFTGNVKGLFGNLVLNLVYLSFPTVREQSLIPWVTGEFAETVLNMWMFFGIVITQQALHGFKREGDDWD